MTRLAVLALLAVILTGCDKTATSSIGGPDNGYTSPALSSSPPGMSPSPEPSHHRKTHWSGDERIGYETAFDLCSSYTPEQINRQLGLHASGNPADIADRYATQDLAPAFQAGGRDGCLDAFQHKPRSP